ncbi:MAG TPA: dihydroorotate dehydrogenase electron transfer subunit [Bacillota bacterium]|jgi:dihydroorotate dehydrogenase electron transfer subunit|nr:dihydroorotate dehydrogenase electron transfer subunit [Bacillota bacterium]HPZ14184.1 dihydroorotate dehydrogenase electron transfer subunit [Bacillota bacterium]
MERVEEGTVCVETATIIRNDHVGVGLWEMEVAAPRTVAARPRPGQFVHACTTPPYLAGEHAHPLLRRPFSLYDVDTERESISILYKARGTGSSLMTRFRTGDLVDIMGPLGRGFSVPRRTHTPCALLVGGGVGIAPLVYLARVLVHSGWKVDVLYGANTCGELVALYRLQQLGASCHCTTLDESSGARGVVTDLLPRALEECKPDAVYTCGPEQMMATVARFAQEFNISGEASLEAHMACGIGACLGCARKLRGSDEGYVKVCVDGPVFPLDSIEFEAEADFGGEEVAGCERKD